MFDANMRYIPKGVRFFAEVHSVKGNGNAYNLGLRRGDVVMCHMLNNSHKNPCVDITINGTVTTLSSCGTGLGTWIVYAGNIDGKSDFIRSSVKDKANKVLSDLTTG